MPPKIRGRPVAATAPQPEPEPAVSDDNASNQSDQDQISDPGSDSGSDTNHGSREAEFKFFNTTFSTFRVSPLYIAQNNLTPAGLETLSRRLRDTLVGDVVRGVQVGLEGDNATLGRLGILERVEWRECSLATILPSLTEEEGGNENEARHRSRGGGKQKGRKRPQEIRRRHLLCLELEYEKATFSALLLPSLDEKERNSDDDNSESPLQNHPSWTQNSTNPKDEKDTSKAFTHYPLLLTRMPAALKSVVVDFLSSTFDCRISALRLGTRSLIRSWEKWIGGAREKTLSKDVALTLGFHLEPSKTGDNDEEQSHAPLVSLGLKTIDVVVPADEVRRFLRAGRKGIADSDGGDKNNRKRPSDPTAAAEQAEEEKERFRKRKMGGSRDEEGWWWIPQTQSQTPNNPNQQDQESETFFPQPFTTALATYLSHHLALDLFHPGVRVLRVVCDAFALSEGRVKVFAPRGGGEEEVEVFMRDLIRLAQGRDWGGDALRLAALEVWG
ncbi:kinetochore complex Sim4 subunit Fta1-domain-containing protein [Xylaria flabelliformis]|nr:kinetochore complex Sim4 subunit Fta1-domain-containing protein [Xylaria flabelliformis]